MPDLTRFFPANQAHTVGDDYGLVYVNGDDGQRYTLLTDREYARLLRAAGAFSGVKLPMQRFPWREGWPDDWGCLVIGEDRSQI